MKKILKNYTNLLISLGFISFVFLGCAKSDDSSSASSSDTDTDVTAFSLSGNGHWGKSFTAALDAPITNNAGTGITGDVAITSTGFEAAEILSVVVILRKESGYDTRTDYSG